MNVASVTSGASRPAVAAGAASPGGGQAFGALVDQLLAGQAQAGKSADQAVQALATGQADNLHAVSLAVTQADLSFRLILELRNRVTEAYQDVMRMQV